MTALLTKGVRFLAPICLIVVLLSCGGDDDKPTSSGPDLAAERRAIEDAYRGWSLAQIAQNYDQAISYTVPGGNGYNMIGVAKNFWDDGWQYYFDLQYVEAWLEADDLQRGYGEAVGNLRFYQYKPSQGAQTMYHGFASTCRKLDGKWKINGVNINVDQDWWR